MAVSEVSLVTFLQSKVSEAETRNEQMAEEKNKYAKLLEDERANSQKNGTRVTVLILFPALLFLKLSPQTHDTFNCFFNRLRNWRSQTRSFSSAGKRFRKLSLRYTSPRVICTLRDHMNPVVSASLFCHRLLFSWTRPRSVKMPETFSTNVLRKIMQHKKRKIKR